MPSKCSVFLTAAEHQSGRAADADDGHTAGKRLYLMQASILAVAVVAKRCEVVNRCQKAARGLVRGRSVMRARQANRRS